MKKVLEFLQGPNDENSSKRLWAGFLFITALIVGLVKNDPEFVWPFITGGAALLGVAAVTKR